MTIYGILEDCGINAVNPNDLQVGETFYAFLESDLGYVNDNTRIEKRKVEEINSWVEHWNAPDYLGGDCDYRECRIVYTFTDDEGREERVVVPKVPHNWVIFRTEHDAANYALKHLEAEKKLILKDLEGIKKLEEKFNKLL